MFIPSEYYYGIYLVVVSVFTIYQINHNTFMMYGTANQNFKSHGPWGTLWFVLFMILFIGFRPISDSFGDMPGYAQAMVDHRFEYIETTWDNNFVFQPMMAFLSAHGAGKQVPIIILAAINFGATFFAMKKLFPQNLILAMLVFFGAFSTFGAATNGLKAGCAMAFFLLALAYWDSLIFCVLFLFLSLGFHHAMQLPIVAFIICRFYSNTNVYLVLWFICLFLAAFQVTYFMNIFGNWTDEHGSEYLYTLAGSRDSNFTGKLGFRFDFILYSSVPIVLGWLVSRKKRMLTKEYTFFLNLYILINAIWMLCMYASFTNRIAYLSWGIYPVLIIYPFIKYDWSVNARMIWKFIIYGHLVFTIIMAIINS